MAGGGEWPCRTAISSKLWARLFADPMKTGQRWYCKVCTARYRAKFGVLIEIIRGDKALYCKADCPDDHVKDAKAMIIERNTQAAGHRTPEELYRALPVMRPMDRGDLLTATGATGHFTIDKEAWSLMPTLKWTVIFALATTEQEGKEFLNRFADATGMNEGEPTGMGHPVLAPP